MYVYTYVYVYIYMYITLYVSQSCFSLYEISSCPRTYALTLLEDFRGALRVAGVAGRATVASTVISALGRSAKWQQALLVTEEEIQPVDVTLGRAAIGGLMWRVST